YIRLIQTRDYKTSEYVTYIPKIFARKVCDENDIMIGRYGPPIFQICRGLKGAYNVALMKAVPKDGIDREFLYYFLKQKTVFEYVDKLSARTGGQTGVDLVSLNKYPVRLPEQISDQKKIVEPLVLIDKKILINQQLHAEIEKNIKLIYDYWFLQYEFPNQSNHPYKLSGGDMVYNEIFNREIPSDWRIGTLNELGEIVGGSTPSTDDPDNFSEDGFPWISPVDLSKNSGKKYVSRGEQSVSDKGLISASLKKYPAGTVLLSSRAPIGYMAIAQNSLTTNQGFKSFIPSKKYSTEFIYYTILSCMKRIIQYSSGSTFKEVSGSVLKSIPVILPPYEVVDLFTSKIKPFFDKQKQLENEINELENFRDWLLPMLINGQISIKDAEEKIQENLQFNLI
ncbi:hypothetical protein DOL92_17320, partial [Acinetobacter nosocomialis]|uniref:restriction endonuclease subunit S n=3 Tax=Acinetobacter TaxID=469 RepID=UPI000DA731D8